MVQFLSVRRILELLFVRTALESYLSFYLTKAMKTTKRYDQSPHPIRPITLRLYILGAISLGFSALYGGVMLMLERANDPPGMPMEWLDDTPFTDYFVPGVTLFSVFGVGSFVTIFGVIRRRSWGWVAAVSLGFSQVGWIFVEMFFLRTVNVLHIVYGGLGAALGLLALSPSFRAYLHSGEASDAP